MKLTLTAERTWTKGGIFETVEMITSYGQRQTSRLLWLAFDSFDNPQEIFLLPFGCISDAVPICGSRRLIHFHNGGGGSVCGYSNRSAGSVFQ